MIRMIVALDRGNAIGWADGRLPWRLKADMQRFKELTTGSTVVMGRTTFKTLGRPGGLPNRKNFVLTRRPYSEIRGDVGLVNVVSSLEYFSNWTEERHGDLWIIGGASVYNEALERNMVDEIYVTLVDANSGADVKLGVDLSHWKHWILTERTAGRNWFPVLGTSQVDGEITTTYLNLKKIPC